VNARGFRFRAPTPGLVLAGLLLSIHVTLGIHAAFRLSPVWDEIVNPAAGLLQWKTGRADFNAEHPFLAKLILSSPLVFSSVKLPPVPAVGGSENPYNFGFQFTYRQGNNSGTVVLLPRLAALTCSVVLGVALFVWGRRRWGDPQGVILLGLFLAIPVFRSRAGLALLEMPQFVFLGAGFVLWDMWKTEGRRWGFWGAGVCAAASLLCKSSSLAFWAALALADVTAGEGPWRSRITRGLVFAGVVGLCVAAVYLPWAGGARALKIAVLFPHQFGTTHNRFYFAGSPLIDAPSFLSWVAFALKAPLAVSVVCLWGAGTWWRAGTHRPLFWRACWVVVGVFVAVLFMPSAVSTVQLSSAYLGLIVLGAGAPWEKIVGWRRGVCAFLGLAAALEVAGVHPNALAYFNPLAGGAERGAYWLADSDQDWGQGLPGLKRHLDRHGRPGLLLAYSGAADPEAHGLRYQDVLSPALVSRFRKNVLIPESQPRVFLALSTKVRQLEPGLGTWLDDQGFPKSIVDSCFHVYDVSARPDAFEWLAEIYDQTRRPTEAAWARARARAASKETL